MTKIQRSLYAKKLGQASRCWLAFEYATLTERYNALRQVAMLGTDEDVWNAFGRLGDLRAKLNELSDEIQRRA